MSTLCSRRARFCCCSMRSDADAGGEAALMLRMTRMLSSGRGGRLSSSRLQTFMLWSCSNPPSVNCNRREDFNMSLQFRCYFFVVRSCGSRYDSHQYTLPQQQQHLLHWEVRGMAAAELGNHTKEHDRNGLVVEQRRSYVREEEWE